MYSFSFLFDFSRNTFCQKPLKIILFSRRDHFIKRYYFLPKFQFIVMPWLIDLLDVCAKLATENEKRRLSSMQTLTQTTTAVAFSNIAFIKYWGDRDSRLRLPANGSISMNLDGLTARTRVILDETYPKDTLMLNGELAGGLALTRVSLFLDLVRAMAGKNLHAAVESQNNFPTRPGSPLRRLLLRPSAWQPVMPWSGFIRTGAFTPGAARLRLGLSIHPGRVCRMAAGHRR